jgi:septum formation protein
MRLILASISPRRRDLLQTLRVPFEVLPGPPLNEHEILAGGEGSLPERLQTLAVLKGRGVAHRYPDALVLSADTVVVLPGDIDLDRAEQAEYRYTAAVLNKPASEDEAFQMLSDLSGRMHHVISAVSLQRDDDGLLESGWEVTQVYFNALSADQIRRYIKLENTLDKAGGYAIQGLGALLASRIEGDYTNVVGLPLGLTSRLLEAAGVRVL